MSQIDKIIYSPLIFWFLICFLTYYFFIYCYFLNRFTHIFKVRKFFLNKLMNNYIIIYTLCKNFVFLLLNSLNTKFNLQIKFCIFKNFLTTVKKFRKILSQVLI